MDGTDRSPGSGSSGGSSGDAGAGDGGRGAASVGGRSPYLRVAVAGDSMLPTLRDGDWLLCRRVHAGMGVREGDVVVLERPDRPGLVLVKRALRRTGAGWWVEGDNSTASDDSRVFGAVPDGYVVARVLTRYWPSPRRV